MSDSSLIQKLRKEIAGNGKKAAILGLLLVVGLFVWIPQIGRLLSGSKEFAVSPAPTTTPLPSAISADQQTSTSSSLTWQQLADNIDRNDFLHPVPPSSGIRSPFGEQPPEPEVEIVNIDDPEPLVIEQPPPKPVQTELLPAPSQLVLKSTLQGKSTRGAVINGRYYREGETLESEQTSYTLSRVEPRRVILQSGDQFFELLIPSVLPRSEYKFPPTAPSIPENSL